MWRGIGRKRSWTNRTGAVLHISEGTRRSKAHIPQTGHRNRRQRLEHLDSRDGGRNQNARGGIEGKGIQIWPHRAKKLRRSPKSSRPRDSPTDPPSCQASGRKQEIQIGVQSAGQQIMDSTFTYATKPSATDQKTTVNVYVVKKLLSVGTTYYYVHIFKDGASNK